MKNRFWIAVAVSTAWVGVTFGAVSLPKGFEALEYLGADGQEWLSTGIKPGAKDKVSYLLDDKPAAVVTNAGDGVLITEKLNGRVHSFKVTRNDKPALDLVPVKTDKGVACFYDTLSRRCYGNVGTNLFVAGYPDSAFVVAPITNAYFMTGEGICPPVAVFDKTTGKAIPEKEFKVAYSNNVESGKGTAFALVTCNGVHTGTVATAFTIKTTFAVEPAFADLAPLKGSFALEGVTDKNRRGVEFSVITNFYPDCQVRDFSFTLSCPRENRTPVIKNVRSADFTLPFAADEELVVWNGVGETWVGKDDSPRNFSFARTPLKAGETLAFEAKDGFSSSFSFPYFRIYSAKSGKGWTLALGYQGEWAVSFRRTADGVRVLGGLKTASFFLNRGERIVTPTVTLMPFDDPDAAVNGWRRFLRLHVLPRDRRTGGVIRPMLNLDPHESGELYSETTAERLLEIIRAVRGKGLHFDLMWIDAAWYTPKGYKCQTKDALWWEGIGSWKPDPARFPAGLKPVSDELARDDASLLLWYNPESVHELSTFAETAKPYCYGLLTNGCYRYNFTSSRTVEFVTKLIGDSIAENGVGVYREDCNRSGELYWKASDAPNRLGITENFDIQGRRSFWRELRKRFPNLLFDTCAAGGRRLDFATISFPSVPFHYSDVANDVATVPELQRYQHLLNQWFVFRKDLGIHVRDAKGGVDWTRAVSCLAPCLTVYAKHYLRTDAKDDERLVAVWRQVARLMIDGDYRLLTPEAFGEDKWWCCAFNDPESGRGFVQAVRNVKAAAETLSVKLPGLKPGVRYVAEDLVSGQELALGADGSLELKLAAGSGAIVVYRACGEERVEKALTAASYPANGLYAQWDGVENAGRGQHDAEAEVWVNLVNHRESLQRGKSEKALFFEPNGFRFRRSNGVVFSNMKDFSAWHRDLEKNWTFEAFVTPTSGWKCNHSGVLGYYGRDCTGIVLGQFASDQKSSGFGFSVCKDAKTSVGATVPADGIAAGVPVHLAISCDGESVSVFTNGVLVKSEKVPAGFSPVPNASTFRVGRAYDDNNRTFDGTIHAVRVYRRALAAEELASNAAVDRRRFCGAHVDALDAAFRVEGARDLVLRAIPCNAPSAPTSTVVSASMAWFANPALKLDRPFVEVAKCPYTVTNEEEGVVWRCDGARQVGEDHNAAFFTFDFTPVAYRVTAVAAKGGTIEPAVGWAPAGGVYTVVAKPAEGSSFYRWLKGVDATTLMKPTATVHAKGPLSVAVEFESEEISDDDFN